MCVYVYVRIGVFIYVCVIVRVCISYLYVKMKECRIPFLVVLHIYREIGGQKDYAVFGHCVIRCP